MVGPIGLCGIAILVSVLLADVAPDAAEIVDRWQAGVDAIRSYDLRLECESRTLVTSGPGGEKRFFRPGEAPEPPIFRSHIRRSGEKRWGEFGFASWDDPPSARFIFDGTVYQVAELGARQVILERTATVFGVWQHEDYEATFRAILGSYDRIAETRRRRTRVLPEEDGLLVLQAPPAPRDGRDFPEVGWKLWLDPGRNFLPRRIDQWVTRGGRDIQVSQCESELSEVAPGVWAPTRATIRILDNDPDSPHFGQCTAVNELRIIEDRSRFNVEIDESVFKADVPTGYRIIDRIRNATYTEGSSDPDSFLPHLAEEGRAGVAALAPGDREAPPMVFVPDDRYRLAGPALVFLFSAAAVVAAAYLVHRRAKARGRAG